MPVILTTNEERGVLAARALGRSEGAAAAVMTPDRFREPCNCK
jgi:hypothetical protein